MNTNYIFRVWIQDQAVFENDGQFYTNQYLDESHVAVGLFTSDAGGFMPIESQSLYAAIEQVVSLNRHMELLQIIGIQEKQVLVVMQFEGDYEYFALQGILPENVTDDCVGELAAGIDFYKISSFGQPYVVTFKNGKVWAVK